MNSRSSPPNSKRFVRWASWFAFLPGVRFEFEVASFMPVLLRCHLWAVQLEERTPNREYMMPKIERKDQRT